MKRRNFISKLFTWAIVMFLLAVAPLGAVPNGAKLVPIDSWLYEGLDTLYHETGKVIPFTTRPYSTDEYRYYLNAVETEHLSEAGNLLSNGNLFPALSTKSLLRLLLSLEYFHLNCI